jgi:hypothetical protein
MVGMANDLPGVHLTRRSELFAAVRVDSPHIKAQSAAQLDLAANEFACRRAQRCPREAEIPVVVHSLSP